MQYMRAHGNTPGPTQRPTTAGSIAGIFAALPATAWLWLVDAFASIAQSLVLSSWVVLGLQVLIMALAGALYGRIFGRAANDRHGGWLFGISYGFLLWMLGPATLLQWFTGHPLAVGAAAMALFGGHLVYGLVLGLLFPWIHQAIQREVRNLLRSEKNPGLTIEH
jgi:hypothetical protein